MKTLRNPLRNAGLGTITDDARTRPLGVACNECAAEIQYSLSTFYRGFPAINCPGCKRLGYLMRGEREGGRLIWFRGPAPAESDSPMNTPEQPPAPTHNDDN